MDKILTLDFGSQYSQLIARRLRELGVYSEIQPYNYPIENIKVFKPKGIILSGGPASVLAMEAPRCDPSIFSLNIPILGICYGLQLMALFLGGEVEEGTKREYGSTTIKIIEKNQLFSGLPLAKPLMVWMSHVDRVIHPPYGFKVLAISEYSSIAAIADDRKGFYGLQFHPEVSHTPQGKNFS
jgi:GMP synthase (glutamine-hydrolysing)